MSPSNQPKAFITGATGDIGKQLIKLLDDADYPTRLMARRQTQVDDFQKQGFEAVLANLDDSVSKLTETMKGCKVLVLITAAVPQQLEQLSRAIDAAHAAGVEWIIKISAGDTRPVSEVPWVTAHYHADEYLKTQATKHGSVWTILSPSAFMPNILGQAPAIQKGFLPQTSLDGKAGWIDTPDIAAVIAQLLLVDGPSAHEQKTHILTGPELLSAPEMAAILSRQIGHQVRYLHLPGPIFGFVLRMSGMDAWFADGLVAQFVEIVRPNGEGIEVSNAVERITGKPPISFEQFAKRNAMKFKGFDLVPYFRAAGVVVLGLAASAIVMRGTVF